jgi:hypothetical protein
MKSLIRIITILSLSPFVNVWADDYPKLAEERELAVPLEPWAKKITVDSPQIPAGQCTQLEWGTSVNLVKGLNWMPSLNERSGVLVIHPFTPKRPAVIEYPVTAVDVGKSFKIVVRGSDNEPGGKLILFADDKVLAEKSVNSEWVEVSGQIPAGCSKVTVAWLAVGWFFEMLWIDSIEVGTTQK